MGKPEIKENEVLSKHSYYRIGGPAKLFVTPQSVEDLDWIAAEIRRTKIPYLILGAGSNFLFPDEGFSGMVIHTRRLNTNIQLVAENEIEVGASVTVASLLARAAREGWGGLELLGGIPGSLGGVVKMNAGTHLGEVKDILQSFRIYEFGMGVSEIAPNKELLVYRKNKMVNGSMIVLSARLKICKEDPATVKAKLDEILLRRKNSQPVDLPSCGSVFKNPPGHKSWEVIERLGLRGHREGDAQFSEKHCNFIVNLGKASAANVRALIDLAKGRAQAEMGILLEEEVIVVR